MRKQLYEKRKCSIGVDLVPRCFYMAERKNAEPAKFHKKVEKLTRGALVRRRYRTTVNQRSSKINQTFKKVLQGKMLSMISTSYYHL